LRRSSLVIPAFSPKNWRQFFRCIFSITGRLYWSLPPQIIPASISPPMSVTVELLDEPSRMAAADELSSEVAGQAAPTVPPQIFYGWLMLPLAMGLMIGTSPGQTFGITFFNTSFRRSFDLTQTWLSAIYLIATLIAGLTLPYIGGLTDRFGLRRSALVATVAMAGVCLWASQTQGIVMLFLGFVMLRIMGPGTLVLLANNTLATWFDRRLGLASALMQVSMAGAMAFVPAGMVWLIDTFGWRGAYLWLAGILAAGLLPLLAVFYRASPSVLGLMPDGERRLRAAATSDPSSCLQLKSNVVGMTLQQARHHRAYWILLAATAIWAVIGTGLVFHLEALFHSHGLEKTASARAMTYMAIGMGAMQIVGGLMADRFALRGLLATAVGLIAVSCVMLAAGRASLLTPGLSVYGLAQGLMSIVAATAWARYFGRAHLGKIRGMSLTAAIAGSGLGPLLMGVSDDYLGGFEPSLWLFAGTALVIAVAGIWATPPMSDTRRTA